MAEPVSRGAGGVRGYGVPLCAGGRARTRPADSSYPEETREPRGRHRRCWSRASAFPRDPGQPAHRPSPGWSDGRRPGSGVRRPGATRRGRSVTQFPPGARGSVCPRSHAAQHPVSPAATGAALLARRPQASGLRAARVPALSRPHSEHVARDGCAPSQRFPRPGTLKARLFDIAPLDSLSMSVLWSRISLVCQTIWKGILGTQVEFQLCNTEILRCSLLFNDGIQGFESKHIEGELARAAGLLGASMWPVGKPQKAAHLVHRGISITSWLRPSSVPPLSVG